MASLINSILCHNFLKLSLNHNVSSVRNKTFLIRRPKLQYPEWFVRKERVLHDDYITAENKDFIREVIDDQIKNTKNAKIVRKIVNTPLLNEPVPHGEWNPKVKRCGLIARKIGNYPLWTKDGNRILTTLLHVADNHVINYLPPEEWNPMQPHARPLYNKSNKLGCLLVGAETVDPSLLTKEYYKKFENSGVPAKRNLCRFLISPEAALSPGTPLLAQHFKVGDFIDVRGKTIDYGFQGVVKRWGFKGMPASHGVTKTHRRPGNIGGGGEKGRVWPGTKLPGHMGNNWRVIKGVQIVRINRKYNVIWVRGVGVPGPTNGLCYLYDTILPLKRLKLSPHFPTYQQEEACDEDDEYDESIHQFNKPTITFSE